MSILREAAGIVLVASVLALPLLFLYGAAVFGVLPIALIGLMVLVGEPIHQLRNRSRQ